MAVLRFCTWRIVLYMLNANDIILSIRELWSEQNNFWSIRVSGEELDNLKRAARLESYTSYSDFFQRTALKEAIRVLNKYDEKVGENR